MSLLIGNAGHARDINATFKQPFLIDIFDPNLRAKVAKSQGVIIGINDPQQRAKIAALLGVEDDAWVHPNAKLYVDCTYGYGTHINYGVTMTRTFVGRHTTISPGVTICGDVSIGDRCLIGAGAVICQQVQIGNDVTIGAGAVVLPGRVIGEHLTLVGVPAR